MATGSTIHKVQLNIADMDRNYYETHDITIAQHPSQTHQRLMIRLVAFALNAMERLTIAAGIGSEDEEAELWEKNYGGDIEMWIDLGQVDEKRLRKACGRAKKVIVYTYNLKSAQAWWRQNSATFTRFKNLSVIYLDAPEIEKLCARSMRLQCNISDGVLTFHSELGDVSVSQEVWQ